MLPFIRSDLTQFTAYTAHTDEFSPGADRAPIDHLDTNECPYDLPTTLKQKLAWTYQHALESNRYPDGGHGALKQAIAAYVNESANLTDAPISAGHISVGNGSDELIRSLLIATCLRGEGAVLVADPTFSMYAILARTLGIPVESIGRSPITFEMDLKAAKAAIDKPQTASVRIIFVVHPNSPTGNALTPAELDWLRHLPPEVLVVIDEAYFEFSQSTLVSKLRQRPNWVVLRTFSKAFRLAAHRVGYAIAHPELTAILEKVRLPYNLPSLSQAAALTALTHRQELLSVIPEILAQRQQMAQTLTPHPALQVWDSAANFLFIRLQADGTDRSDSVLTAVRQQLQAEGTLIRQINGGLRITIGSPAENQRLLDRLQTALDQHLPPSGLSRLF